VRALVVSNMLPDAAHPERGRFVRDQVEALRALGGIDVDLYEFPPGLPALLRAPAGLRKRAGRRRRGEPPRFDVVHAHFGLSAWPALGVPARVRALTMHGTDLLAPRTRLATAAVLPLIEVIAAVSTELAARIPGTSARRRAEVLPCGVDIERFRPAPPAPARAELGLDPAGRYLLFPADPARPEKRHDRALALAQACGVRLLTLGGIAPELVPTWVHAADAVIVPSEREGFGLAVLEALACEVPVLATPVGIHPQALAGVEGSLCAPFELARWRAALQAQLQERRVSGGRASAARFSAARMAENVAAAWRAALQRAG
jgi:glycosyltransferase involved in cell wall biosynthesis